MIPSLLIMVLYATREQATLANAGGGMADKKTNISSDWSVIEGIDFYRTQRCWFRNRV